MSTIEISAETNRIDIDVVHRFLTKSYWAQGISRDVVAASIANSLCVGVYDGDRQVGFARAVTDRATFAYLADVFIIEPYRGHGLGKQLVEAILAHPDVAGVRRWILATADAHGLYAQFGFERLEAQKYMTIHRPNIYKEQVNR